MDGKKNAYRFTVQFNAADPHHGRAIDILNAQGRRKAQFIVNAVLHYITCTKQAGDITEGTIDYNVVEDIVKKVMLLQTGSGSKANEFGQGTIKAKNRLESPSPVNITDTIEDDTLKGIVSSLDTFRRKKDDDQ